MLITRKNIPLLFLTTLIVYSNFTLIQSFENKAKLVGVYRNIKFVEFDFHQLDTSNKSSQNDLVELLLIIKNYPMRDFQIRVHEPSNMANLDSRKISEIKAKTICDYLSQFNIANERLIPFGMQFTEPIIDSARANIDYWINKRVELFMIEKQ